MWDTFRATVDHNRRDIFTLGLLIIVGILIFQPMMIHWQTAGDYPVHNELVQQMLDNPTTFFSNTPHFLYHVAVGVFLKLTPLTDIDRAAAWVMTLCHLALIVVIYYQLRAKSASLSLLMSLIIAALSVSLVIIMPINFFTPENLYFGYFTPIVYHNPTVNIMKPFSLLLFFMVLPLFLNSKPLSRRWILPFVLVTFLSLVAKPSFIMAFVPALGLLTFFLMARRFQDIPAILRNPLTILRAFTYNKGENAQALPMLLRPTYINWAVLLGGIVLPAFLILLYQALTWTSSGGIGIDPFRVLFEWTLHYEENADKMLAYKFLMSCAFPLVVYGLHLRTSIKNLMFNLAWITYLVSVAYMYLFVDYTVIAAGDFGWSAQMAALILYVVATIFLIEHYSAAFDDTTLSPIQWGTLLVCVAVFALHVVAGIHWYRLHLSQPMLDLIYIWW